MKCSTVCSFVFVCVLGTQKSSATFEKDSAIDGSTHFLKSLLRNVENYKQIHFTWNIRNLNRKQFISLRLRENENDESLFEGIDADWNLQNMDYTNILRDNTSENKPPKIRYRTKLGDMSSQNRYQTTPYGYKEVLYSQKIKTVTTDLTKKYVLSALVKKSDSSTEKELSSQLEIDSNLEELSPQIMRLVDKMSDGRRKMSDAHVQRSDSRNEKDICFQSEKDGNEEVSSPQIMRLIIYVPDESETSPMPSTPNQGSDSRSEKDISFQSEMDSNEEVLSPQIMRLIIDPPEVIARKNDESEPLPMPNDPNQRPDLRREKEHLCKPKIERNKEVLSPQIMRFVIDVPGPNRKLPNDPNHRPDLRFEKELSSQSEIDSNEEVLSPQIMRLVIDTSHDGKRQLQDAFAQRSDSRSEKELSSQSEIDSHEEAFSPQIMRLILDPPDEKPPDESEQLPMMPNNPNQMLQEALVQRSYSRCEKDLSCKPEIDNNEEVSSPQIMRLIIYIPDERETTPIPIDPNQGSDLRSEKDFSFQSDKDSNEVSSPQIMRLVIDEPDPKRKLPHDPNQRPDLRREEVVSSQSEIHSYEEVSSPQIMRLTQAPQQTNRKGHTAHVKRTEVTVDKDTQKQNDWFTVVNNLVKKVPIKSKQYYEKWKDTIKIFANTTMPRETYIKMFPKRAKSHMLKDISQSNTFLTFFWPLVFENAFMNQKLGLLGLSGKRVPRQSQKLTFFQELEKVSTIKVPVNENKILLSFNDSDLVEGLNRAGLLESSLEFVEAGQHLFTTKEQSLITQNVNAAMDHINKTSPGLYLAINQLIGCIAFYKAERPGYAGGTISSALGVTWQDPRFYEESSVRYYAEQIVHEFIHTSLFLADLVHGLYIDHRKFSEAKVYSPIRKTLRNYDRTFHASYVGTGLVAFHARAGHWDRVEKFAAPLLLSIDELIKVNQEFGVLTEAGEATLDAMVDFLTVIRLRN